MIRRIPTATTLVLCMLALAGGALGAQAARGALGQPASLSFAAAREVRLSHYAGAMVAGTFNGGTRADLAIIDLTPAHAASTTATIVRDLHGQFRPVRAPRIPQYSAAIATADLDRDGRLDLVVGTRDNAAHLLADTTSVLLGRGNGTFGVSRAFPIGTEWDSATPLLLADVSGDHRADLVTASRHKLVVLLGRDGGTFAARRMYVIDAAGWVHTLALADVNGDGRPDVVAGSWEYDGGSTPVGAISVLLNDGHGRFGPAVTTTTGDLLPTGLALADLDRDGERDLVVNDDVDLVDNGGGPNHAAVVVYHGNGDGTFSQTHEYDLSELGSGGIVLRDLDGDGVRDAVVAQNGGFDVLPGDGAGGFGSPITFSHAHWTGAATLAVADYNGDGRLDVAVSDAKTLSVFLNTTPADAP